MNFEIPYVRELCGHPVFTARPNRSLTHKVRYFYSTLEIFVAARSSLRNPGLTMDISWLASYHENKDLFQIPSLLLLKLI